jgi:HEAT repeats/PBS lyase HEAT-like repeat
MFQLPTNPNLEHLKAQAKDLLKAYKAKDPTASSRIQAQLKDFSRFLLADAQRVIAKEYGFPSWNTLKLHVAEFKTKPLKTRKLKLSARTTFMRELVNQLLEWSKNLESEVLGNRFTMMPLRDILAVRDVLVENKQLSLLVDGLLEGLKHSKPRVRYNCATALDHLADERCTEPLRQLLNDPVARVRRAALHSLSCDACKISSLPNREDLLLKLIDLALNDSSIRVRRTAAYSLAESYDPRAIPILQNLLESPDKIIQRTAYQAIKQ